VNACAVPFEKVAAADEDCETAVHGGSSTTSILANKIMYKLPSGASVSRNSPINLDEGDAYR
jgi:hypothetical protein